MTVAQKAKLMLKFIDELSGSDCELNYKFLRSYPCAEKPLCCPCKARHVMAQLQK